MRNDCSINFHLSKLSTAKFSILYDERLSGERMKEEWGCTQAVLNNHLLHDQARRYPTENYISTLNTRSHILLLSIFSNKAHIAFYPIPIPAPPPQPPSRTPQICCTSYSTCFISFNFNLLTIFQYSLCAQVFDCAIDGLAVSVLSNIENWYRCNE